MDTLTATQLLNIWERAAGLAPTGRALAILAEAEPDTALGLATLPIGDRDQRLLALRTRWFGTALRAVHSCTACGERLELELDAAELAAPQPADTPGPLRLDQLRIELRLPDSRDLDAAAACADVHAARQLLAQRCVVAAHRAGERIAAEQLPEAAIEAIAAAVAAADPADTAIEVRCPACQTSAPVPFDIARFLWAEIEAAGLRLFHEVHQLARGYGWREVDILAMTPLRRRVYLELLPA